MTVLREALSVGGHKVRLIDSGRFYAVTTERSARATRYTPFLDRAEFLFERFLAGVTDPESLAIRPIPPLRFEPLVGDINPATEASEDGPLSPHGDAQEGSPETRIKSGDSTRVDVTSQRRQGARRGGRPRVHPTNAAAHREAQRAYRERRRAQQVPA
jgi:hypothetical protein